MAASPLPTGRSQLQFGILPELIGFHLRRAQVGIFQHFADSLAPHDVTPGQFGVLSLIAANPGLCQSDLAGALGVDRSTVVAVINRLSARHWVERRPAPGDRRRNELHLTEAGQTLWQELVARVHRHEEAFFSRLDGSERRQLVDLLRRLVR